MVQVRPLLPDRGNLICINGRFMRQRARKRSVCKTHGEQIFVEEGDKKKAWRCVRCRNERVTESRQRQKKRLVEVSGGKCVVCGYSKCVRALEFHHLDPSTKSFGLGRGGTWSWETQLAEAKKCILLCSNCHCEVEDGLIDLMALGLVAKSGIAADS